MASVVEGGRTTSYTLMESGAAPPTPHGKGEAAGGRMAETNLGGQGLGSKVPLFRRPV